VKSAIDNVNQTAMSQKRRPGRPSKVSRGKARSIIQRIEEGQFLKEACASEAVSRAGFYRWLERNPEFRDPLKGALEKQRSAFKDDAIATIRHAFAKDWKAAAWYLERNYPAEFGRVRFEQGAEPKGAEPKDTGGIPWMSWEAQEDLIARWRRTAWLTDVTSRPGPMPVQNWDGRGPEPTPTTETPP
jgi:hypothetical protein